jgi:hypothetical protein
MVTFYNAVIREKIPIHEEDDNERNYFSRRIGYASVSADHGYFKAAASDL